MTPANDKADRIIRDGRAAGELLARLGHPVEAASVARLATSRAASRATNQSLVRDYRAVRVLLRAALGLS